MPVVVLVVLEPGDRAVADPDALGGRGGHDLVGFGLLLVATPATEQAERHRRGRDAGRRHDGRHERQDRHRRRADAEDGRQARQGPPGAVVRAGDAVAGGPVGAVPAPPVPSGPPDPPRSSTAPSSTAGRRRVASGSGRAGGVIRFGSQDAHRGRLAGSAPTVRSRLTAGFGVERGADRLRGFAVGFGRGRRLRASAWASSWASASPWAWASGVGRRRRRPDVHRRRRRARGHARLAPRLNVTPCSPFGSRPDQR